MDIVAKRYSFLFEDAWFILFQYFYFEKFFSINGHFDNLNDTAKTVEEKFGFIVALVYFFGLIFFNMIFTAITGLLGLTAIPYCFKMIKQDRTRTKIFFIFTIIQILLQATLPIMRVIVFVSVFLIRFSSADFTLQQCTLVGFQVDSFRIKPLNSAQLKWF